MPGPLRLAVFGLGYGQAVHLPVFLARADVQVVAVGASRLDKAREVAERFGVPEAVTSLDAALALGLDAVSVALPPHVGQRLVRQALDAGLAVFAEKPIATDAAAALGLAEHPSARRAAVDLCYADIPAFRELRRLVADEALGRITSVDVQWQTHAYGIRQGTWSWRLARETGGILGSHGVHAFHLMEAVFGPILSVAGVASETAAAVLAPSQDSAGADRWAGVMGLANGAFATMSLGYASGGPSVHRWQAVGERGVATVDWTGGLGPEAFRCLWKGEDGVERPVALEAPAVFADDWRRASCARIADRWIAALAGNGRCDPGLAEAARAQLACDAAQAAAGRRTWVDLPAVSGEMNASHGAAC